MESKKVLAVFDFDDTIIDWESDEWVAKLCPGGQVPDWIFEKHQNRRYVEFLEHLLQNLHDSGVTSKDILNLVGTVPYTDGMEDVLNFIANTSDVFDCIVMSGANTLFIEAALKARGVENAVNKIISNFCHIDDEGRMHVKAYHSHQCTTCPVDICKGALLPEYIRERAQKGVTYKKVVYVGDGANDLCPSKGRGSSDVVMPRKGYRLMEKIEEIESNPTEDNLKAKVIPWERGSEVLAVLQGCL